MAETTPISQRSMSSSLFKFRFLNLLRRFLRSNSYRSRCFAPSDPLDVSTSPIFRNYDPATALQRAVKSLHFGIGDEKETAAVVIGKMVKDNVKVRKLMVDLGVIPALVSMLDFNLRVVGKTTIVAVTALAELANDGFENRALMVEERILSKLPNDTQFITMDSSSSQEFAQLLLSLSSLANTQSFLSSTETVISFLLTILNSEPNPQTKTYCLATLFNISTVLENSETLISNGVVPILLRFSIIKQFSEKSLPTLGNIVITSRGKKAVENDPKFAEILIEILRWEEKPKSQELSSYIIMVIAHQSAAQREKLAKCGIVPALLELALLGSPLGQKRAMKLLQWFKDERQARVGPHSGPQTGRIAVGLAFDQAQIERGKKAMRNLVEQSLCKNMERITRRANGGECSKIRSLVSCPSSKSLP